MVEQTELNNQMELRRRELLAQLDNGTLEKQEDIEFLLDQYLKDKEISLSPDGRENLKKIISEGRDNFKSIFAQYEDIKKQNIASKLTTEVQSLGAEAVASTENLSHVVNLDLGLSDVLSKIDEAKSKDNLYKDIKKARQSAAEHKYKGTEDHSDLRANLYAQLNQTKWYQFRRKRDTERAIRDINPDDYWSTKKVNGNSVLGALGYYGVRQWIDNRSDRMYKDAAQQLETNVKDQIKDSELRWFSRDFGQKLGLKTKSLWRTVTFRSTDRILKKLTSKGNITELNSVISKYNELGEEYKTRVPSGSRTKLQQRYWDTVENVTKQISEGCNRRLTVLNRQYVRAMNDAENVYSPEIEEITGKYKSQLQKVADSINKNTLNDIKDCPAYKAYLKAHGGKIDEKGFEKVTAEDVLRQILDNKVQSGEMSQDEANRQMEIFYPKQEEMTNTEKSKSVEQEQEVEKTVTIVKEDENSKPMHEALELDEENSKKIATELKNDGWEIGKDASQYTRKTEDGATQVVNFLYNPDNNNYSMKTVDENGNQRAANDDDYKAMARVMKENGVGSVDIGNIPPQDLEKALTALEDAGINVSNKDEVKKRIEDHNKEVSENEVQQKTAEGSKDVPTQDIVGAVVNKDGSEKEVDAPTAGIKVDVASSDATAELVEEVNNDSRADPKTEVKSEKDKAESADIKERDEKDKFKSIEDVRASVYSDTTLTDEQKKAKLSMIQSIDKGNHVAIGEIMKTFGKDTREAGFLGDLAAANDLNGNIETKEDLKALNDLKKEVGIEGQDHLSCRFNEVKKVVHSFEDNKVNKDDAAYQSLSKDEQGYVDKLCRARFNAKTKKGETQEAAMDRAERECCVRLYNNAMMKKQSKSENKGQTKTRTPDQVKKTPFKEGR